MYFNSASLCSDILSITPRRANICNPRSTSGRINSCNKRPYVAPRIRIISALRAMISVAVISFSLSSPSLSANSAWRIRSRKSFSTIWDTSKFAPDASGVRPDEPTAFGIIAPGVKFIFDRFITPSSSACHMPETAIVAFFSTSSTTLFAVFISGNARKTGPRPYCSPLATAQRNMMYGFVSNLPVDTILFSISPPTSNHAVNSVPTRLCTNRNGVSGSFFIASRKFDGGVQDGYFSITSRAGIVAI